MNYIKPIAIAVIVLALVGLFAYLTISKSYLQSDLAKSQQDVAALTIANQNFMQQVNQQNAAIQSAHDAEEKLAKSASLAVAEAQKKAAQTVSDAEATLAAKPTSKDDCKASEALMDRFIRGSK